MKKRKHSLDSLGELEFRRAFFKGHIRNGLAHQVRLMRKQRGWSQKILAEKIGASSQSIVARIEDPAYGRLSLATIVKLADAFDVAALVRFVEYGRLLDETSDLTPAAITPLAFTSELANAKKTERMAAVQNYRAFDRSSTVRSLDSIPSPDVVRLTSTFRSTAETEKYGS